jgi:hypothetical protein
MNTLAIGMRILVLQLVLLCGTAFAHKPSDSYLQLRVDGERLEGQWDISLRDLDLAISLDANSDNAITWGEVRRHGDAIERYALGHLGLSSSGRACGISVRDQLIDHHTDGAYSVLMLEGHCSATIASLDVHYSLLFDLDAQHRGLLKLQRGDRPGAVSVAVFPKDHGQQHLEIAPVSAWRGLGGFVLDGVHHIAIGYDHILFLIALLLPAVLRRSPTGWTPVETFRTALWSVAAMVTAFTAAHSITLSLATLGWVDLPSRLVESGIALSVLLTALDNLFPFLPRRRWLVAFVFGLLHGFGFASVLRDLNLPTSQLALSLFGFNIGVEIGQLILVLILVPLAFLMRGRRTYTRYALGAGSLLIAALATAWLLERSLNLTLIPT